MKRRIVHLVSVLTGNRVRGQQFSGSGVPSLRWWWTPWTYRFGHGGWIFLNFRWSKRFWNGV